MATTQRLHLLIRSTDRNAGPDLLAKQLAALDGEFTETLSGGVGHYDAVHRQAEIWLFDADQEPLARELLRANGFEVVDDPKCR